MHPDEAHAGQTLLSLADMGHRQGLATDREERLGGEIESRRQTLRQRLRETEVRGGLAAAQRVPQGHQDGRHEDRRQDEIQPPADTDGQQRDAAEQV